MMRFPLSFLGFLTLLPCAAQVPAGERPDLLRFTNGDRLHGTYLGIAAGNTLDWQAEGTTTKAAFDREKIRQVVLRTGRPERAQSSLSHVALVNGDRVPGEIVGLTEQELVLETSYAGTLRIPREQVAMMAPSPTGGKILYHGPFEGDEWKITALPTPDLTNHPGRVAVRVIPAGGDVEPDLLVEEVKPEAPEDEEKAEEAPVEWTMAGAAWYWHGKSGGSSLSRTEGMTDQSVLKFELAWQNRLSFAIAFHTDFTQPEPPKPEEGADGENPQNQQGNLRRFNVNPGDVGSFPKIFGTGYVLHMQQHHQVLFRSSFDENGQPQVERLQPATSSMGLGESGTAVVELRCNRITGLISLYVNGEFSSQWAEGGAGDGYAGKGNGFGFAVVTERSPVRISDILLAEWNGMPDSAKSLQVEDQDIVLLSNGTDRFSGTVTGMSDGMVDFKGRYGDFRFPLAEVAEVRFASDSLSPGDEAGEGEVGVRLYPLGKISGKPLAGDVESIRLNSPILGEITVDLGAAVVLEFQPTDSFLDDWDPQF